MADGQLAQVEVDDVLVNIRVCHDAELHLCRHVLQQERHAVLDGQVVERLSRVVLRVARLGQISHHVRYHEVNLLVYIVLHREVEGGQSFHAIAFQQSDACRFLVESRAVISSIVAVGEVGDERHLAVLVVRPVFHRTVREVVRVVAPDALLVEHEVRNQTLRGIGIGCIVSLIVSPPAIAVQIGIHAYALPHRDALVARKGGTAPGRLHGIGLTEGDSPLAPHLRSPCGLLARTAHKSHQGYQGYQPYRSHKSHRSYKSYKSYKSHRSHKSYPSYMSYPSYHIPLSFKFSA